MQIGSIKLDKFVARSQPDVASAVLKLTDEGAEEFVLDLRNNLGGLVEEGVEVARLFLDGQRFDSYPPLQSYHLIPLYLGLRTSKALQPM